MNSGNHFNLRIAGLGGQGVVTLAATLADSAATAGLEISVIDRPRSAMRLCQIYCDVIFGQENLAPLIAQGTADVVVGLEPLEGVRSAADLVRKDGLVLLNASRVPQISDIVTGEPYPELDPLISKIEEHGVRFLIVDVNELAVEQTGTILGANFVLLGILATHADNFPLLPDQIRQVIERDSPNMQCFELGLAYSA
jgi:indolepyruvate ferredoxin oxidoreductase beta subunit